MLCAIHGSWFPTKLDDIVVSVVTGVVAAGAYLSFFTALRIGPLSVVSPVVAAYGGLTVLLAVLVRGETLTPLQAVGAALATLGVILTGLVSTADGAAPASPARASASRSSRSSASRS